MKERITVSIDKEQLEKFKDRAKLESRNISNLTEVAIAEYLGNRNKKTA